MDANELRKAEYDALNQEIAENSARIYQILSFCIPATGAILVLSLNADGDKLPFGPAFRPFVALLPFSVILPSMILVESSLNSTVRIASYLKLKFEDVNGGGWQTDMQKSRSNHNLRRSMRGLSSTFSVMTLVSLCSSLASCAWVIETEGPFSYLYAAGYTIIVIVLLAAFCTLMWMLTNSFSKAHFEHWESKWTEFFRS